MRTARLFDEGRDISQLQLDVVGGHMHFYDSILAPHAKRKSNTATYRA
ncbi:MAG: hypothetical protein JJ902_18545 [Roseibium sp.]|nr:hypothetical protein [Roseibium sp.]